MRCTHPLTMYRDVQGNLSNKSNPTSSCVYVPCGQCMACRISRAATWALRMTHEAQLHKENCFITLTFNDEHNPKSLDKRDLQLFFKRLRKEISPKKISYFACGEYGDKFKRAHYHACIFGHSFDKSKSKIKSHDGFSCYSSPSLSSLWRFGYSSFSEFSFDTANYVAGYINKKIMGKNWEKHYYDLETGEIKEREFSLSSRRPAIGKNWFELYSDDFLKRDVYYHQGKPMPLPKYYEKLCANDPKRLTLLENAKALRTLSSDSEYTLNAQALINQQRNKRN